MRITKGISAILIEAKKFNGYTLVSGEHWQKPTVEEIQLVRGLILLTDSQLANRLDVDERTIRKWKSGETSMVFTTWCCLCWLADWVCRSITLSVAEDSFPDAS
jgi:transcriptional regulator with XRE-family HTH domain